MEIVATFKLSTIDLLGEPLSISAVERLLGLWNVNQTDFDSEFESSNNFHHKSSLKPILAI